jgi:hypothetical protein
MGEANDKKEDTPTGSIYSAEQSAIIRVIYSTSKEEGPKVIIMDSLSTTNRKRAKTLRYKPLEN